MFDEAAAPAGARRESARNSAARQARAHRCGSCPLRRQCLPAGLSAAELNRFEQSVQRCRTLVAGEHLFRVGDDFHGLYAVQTGCFKTFATDADGREHIMTFNFAGEIIGVDAIHAQRHVSSCIALAPSGVCVLPFAALTRLTLEMPPLQAQVLRMLSRYVVGSTSMAGDFTAEERLAGFLVMVAARMGRGARPGTDLDLAMSRQDIANFLRLAPETVSRLLARFQRSGLLSANRRHITLLDPAGLGDIAACMNPYARLG